MDIRQIKVFVFTLLTVLVASGCATSYKSEGLGGGYTDMNLGGGRYRIDVSGNSFTSPKKVQNIAMVRAADLTIINGYQYFIIMDTKKNTKTDYNITPSYYSSSPQLHSYSSHSTSMTIKLVSDNEAKEIQAIKAKDIIASLGQSVGYKK